MSKPVTFLSDFPDRMSPMLVKELRQGMRAKTFIAVFLSLQIFLSVMLFSAGAAASSSQVGALISGIIFVFFAIAVVLVQPMRGTGALSSEVKGNTIDMMVLTRLSAWRIVFGKWIAIVGQSALLFSTIVPYLILRYFFGGMNLFGEMTCLALLFLTSMGLTAVTVGLSGCESVIIRSLIPLFGLPMLLWMLAMLAFSEFRDMMEVFALNTRESRIIVFTYVAVVLYLGWSMLSWGASLISPAAENHSLARRLVASAALLAALALGATGLVDAEPLAFIIMVLAIPAVIIALTDSAPLVQTTCMPFVKRGPVGRFFGVFLYPTWFSGVLFAVLFGLVASMGLMLALFEFPSTIRGGSPIANWDEEVCIAILAIFGGLLFPAVWQVFLFRGEGQRVAHYLLILVGSSVVLLVLLALADTMNSGNFLWFFAWNPLTFLVMMMESRISDSVLLVGVMVVDLLLMVILLGAAALGIKQAAPVIREAAKPLENPA